MSARVRSSILLVAFFCVIAWDVVRGNLCSQANNVTYASISSNSFTNVGSTESYNSSCGLGNSPVWLFHQLNTFIQEYPGYFSGNATITVSPGFIVTVYAAPSTDSCSNLTPIACGASGSAVQFPIANYSGGLLYFQIASSGSSGQSSGTLNISLGLNPPNQVCEGAARAYTGSNNFSSIGSTTVNPPTIGFIYPCNTPYYPVWFYFDPPTSGSVNIRVTSFSDSDTSDSLLYIYQGTCSNLTLVTCNDDSIGLLSQANFTVTTARIYFHIGSYGFTATGIFAFDFASSVPAITTGVPGITTAAPGTTTGASGTTGASPSPPNQVCATASQAFSGSNGFSSIGATTVHPSVSQCYTPYYAMWYYYDPPSVGSLSIRVTYFSATDSVLNIYQGTCSNLSYVNCNDDAIGQLSLANATITSTARIYFHIGSYATSTSTGNFTVTFNVAGSTTGTTGATPSYVPNQVCTGSLQASLGSNNFSSIGSTTINPSPYGSCGLPYYAVWFYYDPPTTGTLTVAVTYFSAIDSILNIYQGTCSGLTLLNCNDDYNARLSQASATISSTSRIYFHIGTFGSASTSTGTFTFSFNGNVVGGTTAAPSTYLPNQVCSGSLQAFSGSNSFSSIGSTTLHPSISTCGNPYYAMWYYYDPPSTGYLSITVTSFSATDSLLNVYQGSCSYPVSLACNDDYIGRLSQVNTSISSTNRIYFHIGTYGSAATSTGAFTLSFGSVAPSITTGSNYLIPTNQVCAGAFLAYSGSNYISAAGSTTVHPSNSNCGNPYYAMWFYYDPPTTGTLSIRVTSYSSSDSLLNIYSGSCSNLFYKNCNDDYYGLLSAANVTITSLTRIYFHIGSYGSIATGYFTLNLYGLTPVPGPASATSGYYSGSNDQCYGATFTKMGSFDFDTSASTNSFYSPVCGSTLYNTVWYYYDPPTTKGNFTIAVESYNGVGSIYVAAVRGTCTQYIDGGCGYHILFVPVTDSSRIYFTLGTSQGYTGHGTMTLAYSDNGGQPTGNTGGATGSVSLVNGASMIEMNQMMMALFVLLLAFMI